MPTMGRRVASSCWISASVSSKDTAMTASTPFAQQEVVQDAVAASRLSLTLYRVRS